MIFQKFDNNSELLDGVEVDLNNTLSLLSEHLERSCKKYTCSEETMAANSFCISRSESDFLQVNCDGINNVSFSSDRLEFNMHFLLRVLCNKTTMFFEGDREFSIRVITDFFELSRQSFERKYSMSYQNLRGNPKPIKFKS